MRLTLACITHHSSHALSRKDRRTVGVAPRVAPMSKAFTRHLEAHGVEISGIKLGNGVDGERGVLATRALLQRADVLAVPRALLITDADARLRCRALRAMLRSPAAAALNLHARRDLQLVVFLVAHRAAADKPEDALADEAAAEEGGLDATAVPPLGPFYASLPPSYESIPANWPDAALDASLPPTVADEAKASAAERGRLRELLRSVAPNVLARAEAVWERDCLWADPVAWAYSTVLSRGFHLVARGEPAVALVPMADMLNHAGERAVNASWDYDEGRQRFVVRTERPVAAGAELRVSYGRQSSSQLLLHYGFVPQQGR